MTILLNDSSKFKNSFSLLNVDDIKAFNLVAEESEEVGGVIEKEACDASEFFAKMLKYKIVSMGYGRRGDDTGDPRYATSEKIFHEEIERDFTDTDMVLGQVIEFIRHWWRDDTPGWYADIIDNEEIISHKIINGDWERDGVFEVVLETKGKYVYYYQWG